jgi:polyisoprenoid-binding protein YceI
MLPGRIGIVSASLALLTLSTAGYAALSAASDAHVDFEASGPAGLKITGSTGELTAAEDGGNVVLTVALGNLTTGIGLRDQHMKEKYLEVPKFPSTTLTIARSALTVPASGQKSAGDAPATLTLHGQSHPVTVHYDSKADGASVVTHGSFHINMNDFGITVPVYLGVTVKPGVDVNATFKVTSS